MTPQDDPAAAHPGNVARFTGFAEDYDRYRWRPPTAIREIVCRYADVERPRLVVDLGCGTGISTRYWAPCAEAVVGVDPTPDMLARAREVTTEENVAYRAGVGHDTSLEGGRADIVACSQSFHWMEPESTLAEVRRLLRPGGVFVAFDYDGLSVTGIADLDAASLETARRIDALEAEHALKKDVRFHGKDGHEARMRRCGHFRLVRAFALHDEKITSAEAHVRGFETLGALQTLRARGVTDEAMGLVTLREVARRCLGEGDHPQYVSYAVHIGVG